MPNDLLAAIEYGGYISIWKFLFFSISFFAWMPLVNWVYLDTQAVRTNGFTWTLAILCTGFISLLIWLLIPVFFIGLLIFIIATGSVSVAYVMHRNALVADFEKVLNADHLRGLFTDPVKKIEKASHGIQFITSNGNEVPLPEPKSKELEGFTISCDLIDDAVWHRADEIQFIPQKEDYAIIYTVDGVACKQDPRSREEIDNFVYYIKQLAGLEVEEKRKPQHGSFKAVFETDEKTQWEVITSGSTAGERITLEKVSALSSRKVDNLGLNDNQFESIRTLRDINSGLIIISGPKKSGITTTLYTLLGQHDPFLNNINTLEKNPATELTNITQFTYSLSDTGTTTYAKRFQSILRKGPDIVGVANCEDPQTAKLAAAAAKDGRIVYVTMEAANVNQAAEKFLKFIGDKNLLAGTLCAVLNQRLVRTLCDECRQAYQPNPALFKKFNIPADEVRTFYRPGEIEYDKHGKPIVCEKCQGSGFYGRTGLFETIRIDDTLRETLRNAKTNQDIATAFRKAGMLYMQEQSIKKVAYSITSINEVIRNFSEKA
ncbi:MAG: Flp pilus assembly complex ATPase component TadA [Planctomycetes bacterium]|nr:Flp pilus assembly complex ATPase component TadA [Planctomycetota bacterium]